MGFIYILTNIINLKKYVGQTTRPIEDRFCEHQKPSNHCSAIYEAIKKHGWENFTTDYYKCSDDELNKHERWFVKLMNTMSPNGYNLREGGGSRGKLSGETKQKISESMTGKVFTVEHREALSAVRIGKKLSQEHREALSASHKGKGQTQETKEKISKKMKGQERTQEHKDAISASKKGEKNPNYGKMGDKHHNSKRVYQYDLEGKFIASFGSTNEAARNIGKTDGSNIRKCANGKLPHVYKFKWSYDMYVEVNYD